jgi:hypothetical protein
MCTPESTPTKSSGGGRSKEVAVAQTPGKGVTARAQDLVRAHSGWRRRRRASEGREGTIRALARVKLPETARRGGVRARGCNGKRLGFATIREAVDGYEGWDQRVSVATDELTVEN